MSLTGIVYFSKANQPFDEAALQALAEQSSSANAKVNVSGLLMYTQGHFLQYIEGEPDTLLPLMEKISADERHSVIEQLKTETLAARLFPAWNMRWLMDSELQQSFLDKKLTALFESRGQVSDEQWQKDVWAMVEGLSAVYNKLVGA